MNGDWSKVELGHIIQIAPDGDDYLYQDAQRNILAQAHQIKKARSNKIIETYIAKAPADTKPQTKQNDLDTAQNIHLEL